MLVAERQKKIVDLVNLRTTIRVSELSEIFSVTEETIRRDLEKLERENKLRRSHGGALSIQEKNLEVDFSEREIINVIEKKIIAREAVNQVKSGDRIILDASTTAWYMARSLPDFPLTVITNSIKVAMELSKKEKIEVISTGGILLPKSLSYVGPLAERSLDNYHVDKTFLSCKGLDLTNGLSDSNEWQALLKRKMIERSAQTILMVDSSKFGHRDFSHITSLHNIDQIIVDFKLDNTSKEILKEKNITVTAVNWGNEPASYFFKEATAHS
ncbi:DeoR/GlpR transcriptional regulator [Priestia filamentosa]|uniref:DeoR/GlpR family DNA-binding transcription regulator n=1 Tax=Priestia filamentosa TaxID=1402861 RepID=UPI001FB2B37A|nr:DeoR/GlpR family DNA-binding transcription regulator [Priestia filamentosa]MED3729264.1 DeoR/GlpR family DNA-binding transcription regulator [Priestia filamentosa]UOE59151.1 DeoR/GlpR transcriptional regulator [Priestia filamentosa]